MVRKNAVSASQKQRGPSCGATRRKRPLCLVLRRAILLPHAAELLLPVCRLPSQAHAQWLTFVTQLSLFRCILALTVPFAVGFDPFPFRLPPGQTWPLQRAAARLHRTLFTSCRPAANVVSIHRASPRVNDFHQKLPRLYRPHKNRARPEPDTE